MSLVTGASHGIGEQIALGLAAAGSDVAVMARSFDVLNEVETAIRARGRAGSSHVLDQRDRAQVDEVVDSVIASLGRLDVLVCNAGVSGPSADVRDVTDDEWDETVAVNLTGTFCMARAAARYMARDGGGAILLVASMTGKRPLLHRAPYAATKLALVGLSRTRALDLGPDNVRINVISPGFVEGARLDWVVRAQGESDGRTMSEVRELMIEQSPLRRLARAADVVSAVVYLASPSAEAITGVDLNVSAGLVMYWRWPQPRQPRTDATEVRTCRWRTGVL